MRTILIMLFAAIILFSGCVGEKTVKKGDTISVDYTGRLQDGKVFDTSIKSVGIENNIIKQKYVPYEFKVGEPGGAIEGFNDGVLGMKIGETKTIVVPPERGYGKIKPELISTYGIIENISAKENTFPRVFNISLEDFEATYGAGHNKSDTIVPPGTNINLTVVNISKTVSLSYDLKVGSQIFTESTPWNLTVVKIDDRNVSIKPIVKMNQTIRFQFDQFQKTPWNSTVIGITADNITLRHNPIPDTRIQSMYGSMMVRFNETAFTIDQNHELAGKTLIFNVTLLSIDTGKSGSLKPEK